MFCLPKYSYLALFFLVALGVTLVNAFCPNSIAIVSRSFIIPAALLWYCSSVSEVNKYVVLALFFAWLGDILLIFDAKLLFRKLSVSSYLVMQVFFIAAFKEQHKDFSLREFLMGAVLYGSYLLIFLMNIFPHLEDMKLYAVIYGLTISYLGCLSIMFFFQSPNWDRFFLFFGVLVFSIRDVMLTYNKYYFHADKITFPIILTYSIGLLFILHNFIRFKIGNYEE